MAIQYDPGGIWRAYDGVFMNDKCIFIEYHDVIKTPWFVLLYSLMSSPEGRKIFNFKKFDGYTRDKLKHWYFNRRHRNMFADLDYNMKQLDDEEGHEFILNKLTYESKEIFKTDTCLKIVQVIKNFIETEYKSDIVIYNEVKSEYLRMDCINLFGSSIKFVFGYFGDIIEDIPESTTFIFSDIEKIKIMDELDCLKYRSILMCDFYGYNYDEDNKLKVDVEELIKRHPCKIDFFDNIYAVRPKGDKKNETNVSNSGGKRKRSGGK